MGQQDGKERFKRFKGKNRCRFTRAKIKYIDWKDIPTLQRFTTGQGKIFSRKRSGISTRHQRQLKRAIKYARFMGLMPYAAR